MMRKTIKFAVVISLALVTFSCLSNRKYEEEERAMIADYIADNNITVDPDANGLYYIEIEEGSGQQIEAGDSVGVFYTGYFLDGDEFDTNVEETKPFRFRVGDSGLITGWSLGLVHMKGGGKAKILLPSKLAYGSTGYGYYYYGSYVTVIPGYTPLLFEIEVVEHLKPTE